MSILVTGGAGYIGSHTAAALMDAGESIIIADDYSNSSPKVIDRLRELSKTPFEAVECDLNDMNAVKSLFDGRDITAVIHFAGFKAVGESVDKPLKYYRNNIMSTLNLLDEMRARGVKQIVFSSSATVYGEPDFTPIPETAALRTANPYGRTKLMIEDILRDAAAADKTLSVAILRYFNPVGAHPSGLIGECPEGIPNNLVPYIAEVASGKREALRVFGGDYPTPDGTGVRDYIDVTDLALGHIAALGKLGEGPGVYTYNLGTGRGSSVLDVLRAYERACGRKLPYVMCPRRPGDIATCYADPSKATSEINWKAVHSLDEMCESSWNWSRKNPNGYK